MMKRVWVGIVFVLLVACAPPKRAEPTPPPTPTPSPTLPPVTAGGAPKPMGTPAITKTGSRVIVHSWRLGANRSIPNGPGQRYETVDVTFCAGPQVEETTQDLTPLFALELRNGNRVAVDSQSGPGDFRTRGAIGPGKCVSGALVFQVEGGERPAFVRFDSTVQTKWTVP